MNKRVYCHTTYVGDYNIETNLYNNGEFSFKKGNWYVVFHETNDYYTINIVELGKFVNFYKNELVYLGSIFSDYFYTEPEYNRTTNLDRLLDE